MNPSLIVFAIRSFIRLGKTAIDVANQKSLDQPYLMPIIEIAEADVVASLKFEARTDPLKSMVTDHGPLADEWEEFRTETNPQVQEQLAITIRQTYEVMSSKVGGKNTGQANPKEIYGAVLVAQWGQGKGPPSPYARVVLTMADIGLEYVAAKPSVLGIGGEGEKLIGALAANLEELIPDDVSEGAYGPKAQFGQRLVGIFLQAGLKTVSDNPSLVFSEEHLQNLAKTALVPVRNALPGAITEDYKWHDVAEALTGPAVNSALAIVGQNPKAFLGKGFDTDKALGASVSALLITASKNGLEDTFSKQGWIALFQSVATVAAARPEIFIGKADDNPEVVFENVFSSVFEAIATADAPFKGDLGLQVTLAVLDGLQDASDEVFDKTDAWETVAGKATTQILEGLKEGFADKNKTLAEAAFSEEQWIGLVKIFAEQAATSPEMVAGDDAKLQALVRNVGGALAATTIPSNKGTRIAVTQAVLTGLATSTTEIFDQTDPWETVTGKVSKQILEGLGHGLSGSDAAGNPLEAMLTKEQWIRFAQIFAEQAARTPDMIAGSDEKLKAMVSSVGKAVAEAKPPFDRGLGVELTQAVLEGLVEATPAVFDQTDGWERVAGKLVNSVLTGVSDGFAKEGTDPLKSVFTRDRFLSFGRIVAEEVARNPDMVAGDGKRVEGVVAAVARAMAADKNLLLTADDWQRILGVAAAEAARNPDRLFKIDTGTADGQVATMVIKRLLSASAEGLDPAGKRKGGSVLFGQTLVEAILFTVKTTAGNVDKALAHADQLKQLSTSIDTVVATNPGAYGAKELLRVFKKLLPTVIETGNLPVLDVAAVEKILQGKVTV